MNHLRSPSGTLFAAVLCATMAWPGCNQAEGDDGAAGQPCEAYIAAMEKCLAKIPKEQRGPLTKQLEAQRDALGKAGPAAKEQMASGCLTGLATLKSDSRCQ